MPNNDISHWREHTVRTVHPQEWHRRRGNLLGVSTTAGLANVGP
jgi:hypothetical protein